MVERRNVLRSVMGLAAGTAAPVVAAEPQRRVKKSTMAHRTYTGRVVYANPADGEIGRETFTVTIQPNDLRTMRVLCEIDNLQMLRDVSLTVDGHWNPMTGFAQLTIQQQFQGAAWYAFTDQTASCEGMNVQQGRFSQSFPLDGPATTFGTHPVHCDGWKLARIRQNKYDLSRMNVRAFTTSVAPMGASGPALVPVAQDFATYAYIGPETVTVPAGKFAGEHYRVTFPATGRVLDVWAMGEDCVPLRLTSSASKQYYELAELQGEHR
jgi:hypothetical protein